MQQWTWLSSSIVTQPSGCRGDWQHAADTQPDVTENGFILSGVTLICFSVLQIEGTDKDESSVYMLILLPPPSEPYTNTLRLTFWHSNKTVSSSFLGLPVKYPLSQGSSSGCSLRCHFSHCQLASHSLFFYCVRIVCGSLQSFHKSIRFTNKGFREHKAQFA